MLELLKENMYRFWLKIFISEYLKKSGTFTQLGYFYTYKISLYQWFLCLPLLLKSWSKKKWKDFSLVTTFTQYMNRCKYSEVSNNSRTTLCLLRKLTFWLENKIKQAEYFSGISLRTYQNPRGKCHIRINELST